MIEEPAKLTIRRPSRRPSAAQIAAFQGVPTGFVVDALGGRGALDKAIKPLETPTSPAPSVAGPAPHGGQWGRRYHGDHGRLGLRSARRCADGRI